ncbi:hypothetical protein [Azospirillum sp.]|uniref:hypothetical protein n=1 Tax=Azospirillum sp. TaxID=34012 RepID=UPI003D749107
MAAPWPVRWPNSEWDQMPAGYTLSDGNMPLTADGLPAPTIEVEVIGGRDDLLAVGASEDGKRTSDLSGLLRVYLSVAQGVGLDDITAKADAIKLALKRKTLISEDGNRLVTEDPRADDGVAAYEDGSRFCRMLSVPFTYLYRT